MRTFFGHKFRHECQLKEVRSALPKLETYARFERIGTYVYKPVKSEHFIAVGKEVEEDGQPLRIWLDLLHRNSREWTNLSADWRSFSALVLEPLLERERPALRAFAAQPHTQQAPRNEIPLEEAYHPWLEPLDFEGEERSSTSRREVQLFETGLFVDQVMDPALRSFRSELCSLLADQVTAGHGEALTDPPSVLRVASAELRVEYLKGGSLPAHWRILLSVTRKLDARSLSERYSGLHWTALDALSGLASAAPLSGEAPATLYDEVARHTRRTYPAWLLLDVDEWEKLIDEGDINQTLSAEELKVVQDLTGTRNDPDALRLPLFLQGRAGSGKTTVLAHVFARYWSHQWRYNLPGTPLYLALSRELLKQATETAEKLLTRQVELATRRGPSSGIRLEPEQEQALRDSFKTPRDLALEVLQRSNGEKAGQADRFLDANHVNFFRFRTLFTGEGASREDQPLLFRNPGVVRTSPEQAWYILRAFIKGWEPEHFLSPEGLRKLPQKSQRLVDLSRFEEVYTHVWERWYKRRMEDSGLWDDQDLFRAFLSEVSNPPLYTAICCDEAQDLTPVEARFLVSLSHFAHYPLPERIANASVPLFFAGDPFQTVNPSGFRIEVLKDRVYESLKLSQESKTASSVSEKELEYNYRSSAGIVAFSNLIQAWRCQRFGLIARPQKTWQPEKSPPPRLFILGQGLQEDVPLEILRNGMLLVDAQGRSTEALLEEHPFLRTQFDSGILKEENLFSPERCKGLERPRVVVYGFGAAYVRQFEPLTSTRVAEPQADEEYFWNRLYVALTRATRTLLLVDTQPGYEGFWKRLERGELPSGLKDQSQWAPVCIGLETGSMADLQFLEAEDPVAFARSLQTQGEREESPDLLRKASSCFKALKYDHEALTCRAKAEELEGHELEAARSWEQVPGKKGLPESRRLYWRLCAWSDLVRISSDISLTDEQQMLAEYLHRETSSETSTGTAASSRRAGAPSGLALSRFCLALQRWLDKGRKPALHAPAWRALVAHWRALLEGQEQRLTLSRDELEALAEALDRLSKDGTGTQSLGARAFMLLGRWPQARRLWEESGEVDQPRYFRTRAELERAPDSLEWFNRAGLHDRTLQLWQQNNKRLEDPWVGPVEQALQQKGQWAELVDLYLSLPKAAEKAVDTLKRTFSRIRHPEREEVALRIFAALTRRKLDHMALDLALTLVELKPTPVEAPSYAAAALETWRMSADVVVRGAESSRSDLPRVRNLVEVWKSALLEGRGDPSKGPGQERLGLEWLTVILQRLNVPEEEQRKLYLDLSTRGAPSVKSTAQTELQRLDRLVMDRVARMAAQADKDAGRLEPEVIYKHAPSPMRAAPALSSAARGGDIEPPIPPTPVPAPSRATASAVAGPQAPISPPRATEQTEKSQEAPLDLTQVSFVAFEQLRLQNFRAYEEALLDFSDLTILVGKNGAGKSSLFLALDLLREALSDSLESALSVRGELVSLVRQGRSSTGKGLALAVQAVLQAGAVRIRAVYGFELLHDDQGAWRLTQEHLQVEHPDVPGFERLGSRWSCTLEGIKPGLQPESLALPLVGAAHPLWSAFLDALRGLRLYEIRPEAMRTDCKAREERHLAADGNNAANVIASLERSHRGSLRALTRALEVILPGLSRIGVEARRGYRSLYFEQEGAELQRLEPHQVSVGTLRALGVLLALFQQPAPPLVLIEEPEDSIHVRGLAAILECIEGRLAQGQVVISSHHPVALSQPVVNAERTRLLVWERGKSRIYRLKPGPQGEDDTPYTIGELLQINALTLDTVDPKPEESRIRTVFFRVESDA